LNYQIYTFQLVSIAAISQFGLFILQQIIDKQSNQRILLESDLAELHSDTFQFIRNIHAILLNRGLIIVSISSHR